MANYIVRDITNTNVYVVVTPDSGSSFGVTIPIDTKDMDSYITEILYGYKLKQASSKLDVTIGDSFTLKDNNE